MLNCFPKLRGALNTSLEFAFDFFDIPRVKFLEAPPECAFVQGLTQHNFTGLLQLGQSELLGKHLQWQGSALYRITQVLHGTFEHPPVIKRHRLVKHSTNNFPSQFEKMAFGNGIKAHTRQREFAEAFCAWVLPEEATQPAFEAFSKELDHLGCAKWPILTAYRFLLHPQTDVLIKPENLRNAAEVARFEINYRSELNWLTYYSVTRFYKYVREKIADLDPKDNIDAQNFIWCIDPDQYPA